MKFLKRITALVLLFCIGLSLVACGEDSERYGRYRVLKSFGAEELSVGFRNDDFVRYYVEAAIKELAADGTIHRIAMNWFAEDTTSFPSDSEALEQIGTIPGRTLIVGLDEEAFPMSYRDGDKYAGFDVDVANAVCGLLGWSIRFIPIKSENAYVELSSGNIDCAWGGLIMDNSEGKFTTLAPYMQNEMVLVVRDDAKISRTGQLSGKTLAVDVDAKYIDALGADEGLKNSFGKITRLTGGAQACFEALDAGKADAIIVYSIAARYYGK